MGFLAFIGAIYVAYKIVREESGNGDFYRSMGDMYKKQGKDDAAKYQYKKASESDGAVGCSVIFVSACTILVIPIIIGIWLVDALRR